MKESKLCPKCNSAIVMYPLEIMGHHSNSAKVSAAEHSLLGLNLPSKFPIQAAVCGHCGYTELHVADPASMYEEWSKSS
jgi:predicted nucleic-acid-binding Zn-ribbon protein